MEGKKGVIEIEAKFDKLEFPTQFGPEYLTYFLWAITPEGRATNLGEVQVHDDEAKIRVTTELQAFGMIVTAEPYFAVAQPSDVVVLENSVRDNTRGSVDIIQAKYDLLKRGTYLMNEDRRQLKLKPLEPGAPLDLAEDAQCRDAGAHCPGRSLRGRHVSESGTSVDRGGRCAGAQAKQRRGDDACAPGGPDR